MISLMSSSSKPSFRLPFMSRPSDMAKGKVKGSIEHAVRTRCRDAFREKKTVETLIPLIGEILSAGAVTVPQQNEAMPIPFDLAEHSGDVGHRS